MRLALLGTLMAIPALAACASTQSGNNYVKAETPLLSLGETSDITGNITYRERIALRPGSVMTVKLVDISKMDAPSTVLDEVRYDMTGANVPVGYLLKLPNKATDPNARLAVQAQIRDARGKLLFTTDQVYPVMSRPIDQQVEDIILKMV